MTTPQTILSRSIFVYSLPKPLLAELTVRSIQDAPKVEELDKATQIASSSQQPTQPVSNGGSTLRCQTCPGAGFESVEEQRGHFKSDWHRYNVKAKMNGKTVSAEQWEGMVEGEL